MAATQLRGKQVADASIQRSDLDTTTAGEAVIRKVIAGEGIILEYTGADSGTGDVVINTNPEIKPVFTYTDGLVTRIDYESGNYKILSYTLGLLTQLDYFKPPTGGFGPTTVLTKIFYYDLDNNLTSIDQYTIS